MARIRVVTPGLLILDVDVKTLLMQNMLQRGTMINTLPFHVEVTVNEGTALNMTECFTIEAEEE